MTTENFRDVVKNVCSYLRDSKREGSDDEPEDKSPGYDRTSRFPEDAQNGRHISEGADSITPWALSIHKVFQIAPKVRLQRERGRFT
jgi:hypothetical protein